MAFLALLELMRLGRARAVQARATGEILLMACEARAGAAAPAGPGGDGGRENQDV